VEVFLHLDPVLRELISDYLKNRHKDIKAVDAKLKDTNLVKARIPNLQLKVGGRVSVYAHQCDRGCY
jgi:hypothetical protein